MKKTLLFALLLLPVLTGAQSTDSVSQASLDSIDARLKLMKLKQISVTAPKPVYSMTGEVVNYNVENDETVRHLTAWDAIRNAPTVEVDIEGNITMRGSEQVEVWLNGQPTGLSGPTLKAFFEAMPADALARVEVIKNPSAKYMVERGRHIVNIVTSSRLRTSQLLILGLSGNTRPYYSPWFSYVRNTDRLRLSFHLAGSRSHYSSDGSGSRTLTSGFDTTSRRSYDYTSGGANYFGSNSIHVNYKIDSLTDLSLMSWNMLQGRDGDRSSYRYDHYDYLPDTAHYRYLDSAVRSSSMVNGFTNFDIKRRLPGAKGHNLTLGGTWNYIFQGGHNDELRLVSLAEGTPAALLLTPYDRTTDLHLRRNTLSLSLRYNRPVGRHDELSLRLGGDPLGHSHRDRTVLYGGLPDTLRNYLSDYHTRSLYATASWRHEWERVTLGLDLHASHTWLRIVGRGLFPDDTLFRFFCFDPSLSLTYRTESMHYFRLNLSHSLDHPSGPDLTTMRTYDDDSYSVGSRSLRNPRTAKASLSWNRYFSKLGNMSLDAYCNRTVGGIESVVASTPGIDPWLGRMLTYTMPMNIDASFKYGADANLTLRPAAWSSLSLNASLYRSGYDVEGQAPQRLTSWRLYARLWLKLFKLLNVDANLNYGTPTLGLYTTEQRNLTVDLGLSATLLDGRLSLRASVGDLFDSNRYRETVSAPTVASTETSHNRSRFLTFGITYRLGKLDLQWQARSGGAAGE